MPEYCFPQVNLSKIGRSFYISAIFDKYNGNANPNNQKLNPPLRQLCSGIYPLPIYANRGISEQEYITFGGFPPSLNNW